MIVAAPLLALDAVWHRSLGLLGPVILILGYYSVLTVIFNLLPIRGLDGTVAWRIIPLMRQRLKARRVVRGALRRGRGR
jgi:Zn-dependent protease